MVQATTADDKGTAASVAAFTDAMLELASECSARLSRCDDSQLAAVIDDLGALSRGVDAIQVALAGEVERRQHAPALASFAARLGHRSAKELLQTTLGIHSRQAGKLLTMARLTQPGMQLTGGEIDARYPLVGRALTDGDLSLEQAAIITEALESTASRADLGEVAAAELELVHAAAGIAADDADAARLMPELVRVQATQWAMLLDPDGPEDTWDDIRARRSLTFSTKPDGTVVGRIVCTPDDGEALQNTLDAYLAPRSVSISDPCLEQHDVLTDEAALGKRTTAQERIDTLVAIVNEHATRSDTPTYGGNAPTVVVTVTEHDLDRAAGHADDQPGEPAPVARLERSGDLVPVHVAATMACTHGIQPALLDDDGHVLRLGRTQRLFSRAQRRALWLTYRGCVVAGCSVPARWVEAHHGTPWSLGGSTDTDEGFLVCPHHHHGIHAGDLEAVRDPVTRRWRVIPTAMRPRRRRGGGRRPGT